MKRGIGWMVIFVMLFAVSLWAAGVIQRQPSTDGNFELSLIRAQVKGEVLTIQVVFKNTSSKRRRYAFFFRDVYYVDTEAKKKYYALKDTNGYYIAGPVGVVSRSGTLTYEISSRG